MTIKLPPLPNPDIVVGLGHSDAQYRAGQREAAGEAFIELHGQQTVNNQEYPKAWHEGVAAAYEAIRALRTELEAS